METNQRASVNSQKDDIMSRVEFSTGELQCKNHEHIQLLIIIN